MESESERRAKRTLELDVDDGVHVLVREPVEEHNLVDTVEQLGSEGAPHGAHHRVARFRAAVALRMKHDVSTQPVRNA